MCPTCYSRSLPALIPDLGNLLGILTEKYIDLVINDACKKRNLDPKTYLPIVQLSIAPEQKYVNDLGYSKSAFLSNSIKQPFYSKS